MIRILGGEKVAVVGGGSFCRDFLVFLLGESFPRKPPRIVGVADTDPEAPGMVFARSQGIATFCDYRELLTLDGLDVILEMTRNDWLAQEIRTQKPHGVHVIDHFEAVAIWEGLRIEQEHRLGLKQLKGCLGHHPEAEAVFHRFARRIARIVMETAEYSLSIDHELLEHQRTLYQIIEGSTIPTFVINRNHIVTHWNKALERLSGVPAVQVVGTNRQWAPFWPSQRPSMADVILEQYPEKEIRRLYGEKWRRSALIEDAYEAEIFFPSLGLGGKWCFFTAAPIRGPEGDMLGAIETLWDRTEDKRAEMENAALQAKLARSEKKYRTLFNSDPHPIFILDSSDWRILDVNQRAQEVYGYRREEILEKCFLDLGDAEDSELRQGLSLLARGESRLFTKRRHFAKNKAAFYVNINTSLAVYGETDAVIASTTDITESVKQEAQLIQAAKMTTLGLMAAGIAHEINQPLNVIQVCADILKKKIQKGGSVSGDELTVIARDIDANVLRAAEIVRHMRNFARQSDVIRRRVSINDPIHDVFKVLGHQIQAHQIELVLDLSPSISDICAEHNRLEQVFINLVTNAMDALDERALDSGEEKFVKRLTVQTREQDDWVVATVADNGVGMSPEVVGRIFEPFFTTKQIGRGTGLGVSISYGIVQDYDGEIDIASRPGKGTTFAVRFPKATG